MTLDANFGLSYLVLGRAHAQMGRYSEATADLERSVRTMSGDWPPLGDLAYTYGIAGETSKARKLLNDMLERARQAYYPALPIALAYTGLGERDEALRWLQRAAEERSNELWLKTDPRFGSLRSDARFAAILRYMKLA